MTDDAALFDSMPVALVHLDGAFRIQRANREAHARLAEVGARLTEGAPFLGETVISRSLAPALASVAASGKSMTFWGYPVGRAGGPEAFVDLTFTPTRDGVLVTAIDVTNRVAAERGMQDALTSARRTTEKLRATLEQMADGVLVTDGAGKTQAVNDAARTMLGDVLTSVERDDGTGRLERLIAADGHELESAETPWRRAALHGETVANSELVVQRTGEDAVSLAASATPLFDDRGDPAGAVSVLRDVTVFQQTMSELRLAYAHLQENSRLRSEFVANMSHELRTPLNAILGFAQLLTIGPGGAELNARQGDALSRILRNGKNLASLIDGILDVSKIEAGIRTVHSEHFDLVEAVQSAFGELESLALQKNLTYTMRVEGEFPLVFTDRSRLRQILVNLLSNALKYTPSGRVALRLYRAGDDACVEVSDSGIGIREKDIPVIFDKFRQVDGSMTRQVGGIGLGLSIVRELTNLLGGRIDVRSVHGEGSTFTFSLPLLAHSIDLAEDSTAPPSMAERGPSSTARPQRPTVLVVEDNVDSGVLMRRTLEDAGFNVRVADNGVAGLRLARQLRPVAITLDIMMPRMDGWRVLQALREDEVTAKTPVIVCSIVDNRVLGYQLGASEYLTKPVSPNELLAGLTKVGVIASQDDVASDVLVVDDQPAIREVVAALLETAGLSVRHASSGEEAIREIGRRRPRAVFIDLVMPGGMSGFELLARIRNAPETAHLPAIILSGQDVTAGSRSSMHDAFAHEVRTGGLPLPELGQRLQDLLPSLGLKEDT